MTFLIAIPILSILLILATLIPLIRNDFWIFRIFEYPRLQKLCLNLILIGLMAIVYRPNNLFNAIIFVLLISNLIYLIYQIYPFTIIGPKQLVNTKYFDKKNSISLLIANIFQDNDQFSAYKNLVYQFNADIVLFVETDLLWQKEMDILKKDYPFQLSIPLDNYYGMLLYSKLELKDGEVKFLVEKDIPSIETTIILPCGQNVKLFCLHPKPPVPSESPTSTDRDKEILLVGKKAKLSNIPVIVIGDLNDVAWSYTTALFSKISGLLDPRKGRGFFNSFNAKYFFLRFPLDHIFCSANFTLSDIKRLKSFGSDHFPMFVELQYNDEAKIKNDVELPNLEEKKLADEKTNS